MGIFFDRVLEFFPRRRTQWGIEPGTFVRNRSIWHLRHRRSRLACLPWALCGAPSWPELILFWLSAISASQSSGPKAAWITEWQALAAASMDLQPNHQPARLPTRIQPQLLVLQPSSPFYLPADSHDYD